MTNTGRFKSNQNGTWSVVFEEFKYSEDSPVAPYHQVVSLHPDDIVYAIDGEYANFQDVRVNNKQYWRYIN